MSEATAARRRFISATIARRIIIQPVAWSVTWLSTPTRWNSLARSVKRSSERKDNWRFIFDRTRRRKTTNARTAPRSSAIEKASWPITVSYPSPSFVSQVLKLLLHSFAHWNQKVWMQFVSQRLLVHLQSSGASKEPQEYLRRLANQQSSSSWDQRQNL